MNLEKELDKLNEFREIIKATCLSCGNFSTDKEVILIWNDLDNLCQCGERFMKWETKKITIFTAEIQDYEGNSHYFREEIAN
jgi:hypothetical protein